VKEANHEVDVMRERGERVWGRQGCGKDGGDGGGKRNSEVWRGKGARGLINDEEGGRKEGM